jgi:hypothetical protein
VIQRRPFHARRPRSFCDRRYQSTFAPPLTLIDASVWPDENKQPIGRLWQTPEARLFNHDHGDNKKWHYVNFPVGSKSYTASSPFASPHDIVHVINGCITVLEGGQFEKLTSKEALRCPCPQN